MKNLSPEYQYLKLFDSMQMIGWKSLKDFNMYWNAKKISSIFIGTGVCYLLLYFLNLQGKNLHEFIYFFMGLLPVSLSVGLLIYIFMDKIFEKTGNALAQNHARLVWAIYNEKIKEIINDFHIGNISTEDVLIINSDIDSNKKIEVLVKIWNNALKYELNKVQSNIK